MTTCGRAAPVAGCEEEAVTEVHDTPALVEKARLGQDDHQSR
jgi:hypothetical protein